MASTWPSCGRTLQHEPRIRSATRCRYPRQGAAYRRPMPTSRSCICGRDRANSGHDPARRIAAAPCIGHRDADHHLAFADRHLLDALQPGCVASSLVGAFMAIARSCASVARTWRQRQPFDTRRPDHQFGIAADRRARVIASTSPCACRTARSWMPSRWFLRKPRGAADEELADLGDDSRIAFESAPSSRACASRRTGAERSAASSTRASARRARLRPLPGPSARSRQKSASARLTPCQALAIGNRDVDHTRPVAGDRGTAQIVETCPGRIVPLLRYLPRQDPSGCDIVRQPRHAPASGATKPLSGAAPIPQE